MKTILFGLLLFGYAATAQVRKHPIDVVYAKCMEEPANSDSSYIPGAYRSCGFNAMKSWEAEMQQLLARLPAQQAAQAAWVRRRDAHLASLKASYKKAYGVKTDAELHPDYYVEAFGYTTEVTRKRVLELTVLTGGRPFRIPSPNSDIPY